MPRAKTMRLTKTQKEALLGRAPFSSSQDELDVWIWAGRNDIGRRTLDQLVDKGLANGDGREDGFLTYKLTEAGIIMRKTQVDWVKTERVSSERLSR